MNLFLANRFFRNNSQRKRKASVPAIHIATLGVALGLVVMILSVCVVRGFKFEITKFSVSGLQYNLRYFFVRVIAVYRML